MFRAALQIPHGIYSSAVVQYKLSVNVEWIINKNPILPSSSSHVLGVAVQDFLAWAKFLKFQAGGKITGKPPAWSDASFGFAVCQTNFLLPFYFSLSLRHLPNCIVFLPLACHPGSGDGDVARLCACPLLPPPEGSQVQPSTGPRWPEGAGREPSYSK